MNKMKQMTGWAWNQTGLPHAAKYALLALVDGADESGEWCAALPELAKRMGYSPASTKAVTASLRVLEDHGLVSREKRKRPGTSSRMMLNYRIHWEADRTSTTGD